MFEGKKKIISCVLIVIICLVLIFFGFMIVKMKSDKILKNTYVGKIDIGGLTKEDAVERLQKNYKIENINLSYNNKKWSIDSEKIGLNYDPRRTIEEAYNFNKNNGFFGDLKRTISSSFGSKNIVLFRVEYNKESLKGELAKISKNVNKNVKDAYITTDKKIDVVKDESGEKLNINKTIDNINKKLEVDLFYSQLFVDKEQAKVKQSDLKDIDTVLGSYSTHFDSGQINRSKNIALVSKSINNKIVKPGKIFSFNEITGKRSKENGYKSAPVIENGDMKSDYGGGVCQASSTLYNSVLLSGLKIVNVQNHTIPSSYVPKGRDATVSDTGINFLFKNNYNHIVYVKSYVVGDRIYAEIYGNHLDKQNITIKTTLNGVSSAGSKRVNDPTLPVGTEKVDKNPRNSYSVTTYRIYKDKSGKILKKEKVSSSYYPKREGVILVGTKVENKQPNNNDKGNKQPNNNLDDKGDKQPNQNDSNDPNKDNDADNSNSEKDNNSNNKK